MKFDGKDILADVFKTDINQISDSVKIGELPGWDSLGHLRLVLHIEKILNRSLSTEELLKIVDVENIESVLNNNI